MASLHLGMEIAECRFVNDKAFPPLPAVLAERSAMGPPIDDWRHRDIANQQAVLRINGVERRRGTSAGAALDHPLVPST